ncbi:FAD-binding oxidoreductase [Streptomyces sp. A7024]|uniref:FAD-binding oxidoreductase n=1 Tax=Streptomyces coryli TaxID=1128680 RepID=A0A6G4TRY0_9ACTN|nr:FAD-binding oxidoreductase [Streptomyces coryli]NGN62604.1 FAD-binding oxidoreductase [Streptomyces coryli]
MPGGFDISTKALRDELDGPLLLPGDDGYDEARAVWNAMVDRRPRLVARCANTADVAAAIRFGRTHDLEIGVRCGGHGILGAAVPEDGLMIDLTPMGAVRVDPRARRARVQGGALLGALDVASQAHGLATTAGNVSHTGVGGLTLGGGMGWLARQHGLSCDNVVSFEVVTAEGRRVQANAEDNPELYWGLRGGGGNFGVVTDFEFALHPEAGRTLLADFFFELDDAPAAFRGWRDLNATAPRQATFTAWVGDKDGRPQASVGLVWVGDPDEGRKLLPALRALGRPAAESVRELTYLELQTMDDSVEGHTFRRYWKGQYFSELSDAAIEAFLLRGTPDGRGEGLPAASLQAYGGAIAAVPVADTAFSQRDALFEFVAAARWDDPAEDEARMAAARRYGRALSPFASGAYVNVLADEGSAGVRSAYRTEQLARLTALKDAWDPDNVFHLNHNIRPSRATPGGPA